MEILRGSNLQLCRYDTDPNSRYHATFCTKRERQTHCHRGVLYRISGNGGTHDPGYKIRSLRCDSSDLCGQRFGSRFVVTIENEYLLLTSQMSRSYM
jgi:hypothetical protein